jgi:hypothetical protein
MAKKQFFLVIDTETTINDNVADFGAVIFDKQGNQFESCAVLVHDFKNEELFHNPALVDASLWAKNNLANRRLNYEKMLQEGSRHYASVNAINRFLDKVSAKYENIALTAYNLPFDVSKCINSGINIQQFTNTFCLWQLACGHFADTKRYKQFVLDNHYFGNVTAKTKSLTYKTNAEVMSEFLTGVKAIEPHTAFEDIIHHEAHILKAIVNKDKWRDKIKPYNYREYQLKDNFKVR